MKKNILDVARDEDYKKPHHIVMQDGEDRWSKAVVVSIDPLSDDGINIKVAPQAEWLEEGFPSATEELDVFLLVDPNLMQETVDLLDALHDALEGAGEYPAAITELRDKLLARLG